MVAEAARAMVVLAMDIGGDHAADRDEFRPRNDGRKKTARQKGGDDVAQQRARLDGQAPIVFVKMMKAIKTPDGKATRRADRGVAIGSAVAARDGAVEIALQAGRVERR